LRTQEIMEKEKFLDTQFYGYLTSYLHYKLDILKLDMPDMVYKFYNQN
jgi:hypothetical protein